jgi:hypothetical protein
MKLENERNGDAAKFTWLLRMRAQFTLRQLRICRGLQHAADRHGRISATGSAALYDQPDEQPDVTLSSTRFEKDRNRLTMRASRNKPRLWVAGSATLRTGAPNEMRTRISR